MLSPVARENGWQLAERAGERPPTGMRRLPHAAAWDVEAVRDDLRACVVAHLGDPGGVPILDETGFLKQGRRSVGVRRQHCGAAGRIAHCQLGVFLCCATRHGAAFLDRARYLPQGWAGDAARRAAAGVPGDVAFATKPALGRALVERALDAGAPTAWGTGDSVYGNDRRLRLWLEERRQPSVLAIRADEPLWQDGPHHVPAEAIAASRPADRWRRRSAGAGAKGPRRYDRAWREVRRLQLTAAERARGHRLLVRRSLADPTERAYYSAFAPRRAATLARLAAVAGARWQIESGFAAAKGECGLDEYAVRTWDAWHGHRTLALLARAFLAAIRAREAKKGARSPAICPR